MKANSDFNSISRACEILSRYGVQPRYPNEMEITERDMQKAIEYTRQIRNFEPLIETRREANQNNSDIGV